jgi:2-dehydropantoate 2-reductase
LTVKTTHVGTFHIPAKATSDPAGIGPVDLVLFCVKTYDTDTAAPLVRPLIGQDTVVMSLQNGVENAKRIGRAVGEEHVIGATTYISSRIEAPGVINETSWVRRMLLGELHGESMPRTVQLLHAFQRAEVTVEIHPDIHVAIWSKLLAQSAFAAVACVTRLPVGAILACPETTALLWAAVDEGFAVARASGVAVPDEFLGQLRRIAATMAPTGRPSMYHDLEAGRRLELEDLVGAVVRMGAQHGVATPLTFAMYAALKPYVNGAPSGIQ